MEKSLKEFIRDAWGTQDSEWFPGPQPISIERRHFPMLKRQPYLVCEKTDGTRYMLVSWTFDERRAHQPPATGGMNATSSDACTTRSALA